MGSGGQDRAQRAAEQRERENEARIAANTSNINQIFDDPSRAAQIGQFTDAVRTMYREELDRVKLENDQQLTFAMARSGQTGSSLEKDQRVKAGEAYQRGTIEAERGAQGSAAELRAADEAARAQMLQMAQAGGQIGDAQSRAAASLQNNLQSTKSAVHVKSVGEAFDQFGDVFERSKQQSEYRRGINDGIGSYYTPGFGFGGNSGRGW